MRDRGQSDVIIEDVFQYSAKRFDTLLMLMNGIGMVGSIEGLTRFLNHADGLLVPGGQILCDSIDVGITNNPQHIAYREANLAAGRPAGQQACTMECEGEDSVRFDWLHIDFQSLAQSCTENGWRAKLLEKQDTGHYLCKLEIATP